MQQQQGRASVGKTSGGTPTPPGSAWQQPTAATADSYNYNLSPSRSPGSIYRSTSSASSSSAAAAAQAAAAAAAAAAASSAWSHWPQGNGQATGLELSHGMQAAAAGHPGSHPHAAAGQGHHELGDMLSMLGHAHHPHHPGSAAIHPVGTNPHHPGGFENISGMFTGQFQ